MPSADFDPTAIRRLSSWDRRKGLPRNTDGLRDLLAPPSVGQEMLP
jgi:hypothetical protein